MSGMFVVRNQLGHYWSKSGSWVSGSRAALVACWEHRDEAVNTLFELGSKDTDLRGEVVVAQSEGTQLKHLEISEHPVPEIAGEPALETDQDDPTN